MIDQIFGGAVEHLTRGLTYATARHSLLAQNVANVETPGYQARDLVFEDFLKPPRQPAPGAMPKGIPEVGPGDRVPRLVLAADADGRADGNDVQLHRQMARLAENTLYQHTLVQLLTNQFNTLKQAISGRV
ncbi:MAG TPA: flagellar basal body rod protein FlgB [Terriglobales bacterium]|nr:flagellar basal body rod protein FlgB [Terriglobales bacterium]